MFPLLVVAALPGLFSCGSPSRSGEGNGQKLRLREGTITYHDPAPRRGSLRKYKRPPPPLPPLTLVITTHKARVRERADVKNLVEIFRRARQKAATVVTPERFEEIWMNLVDAGIWTLPRAPGPKPPADRPSIQMESGGRRWIFTRPEDLEKEQMLVWRSLKAVLVLASN